MAVLKSSSLRNWKGFIEHIVVLKMLENIYWMRAPPTSSSLLSILLPSIISLKHLTNRDKRARINIPWAFLSVILSKPPVFLSSWLFSSRLRIIVYRREGRVFFICLIRLTFSVFIRYFTPIVSLYLLYTGCCSKNSLSISYCSCIVTPDLFALR